MGHIVTERSTPVSRPKSRPRFPPALMNAALVALMAVCFLTPLGAIAWRVFPYLVVPAVGVAYLAADRSARVLPFFIWTNGVSLLAAAAIAHRPTIAILSISVPIFALFAVVLTIGFFALRRNSATMRQTYPVIAFVVVVSLLLIPVTREVKGLHTAWNEQVTDVRKSGSVHQNALAQYGTDYVALMQLIKEKTPETAVIALPGQNAFPIDGNPELANYFLYPRTILSANMSRTPVFDPAGASYIVSIAQDTKYRWPLFSVPVRMYYHTPARHRVTFGEIDIRSSGETTKIAPSEVQPWRTNADRTLESDTMGEDGTRTVSLMVTGSVTDPWVAAVNLPLTNDTSLSAPVTTNAGDNPAISEQVALLVEVQGPGGERALFASRPAPRNSDRQTLALPDLSRRAAEYARARNWRAGPLTMTHIGLELGWQVALASTKTDTLIAIERGDGPAPDGPESFAGFAREAQRQIRAGNPNAALDVYAIGLLLRPDNLDGQLALGEVFRIAGRWQEGAKFFAALLNDYPSDPWIRYRLATMQYQQGDRAAARLTLGPLVGDALLVRVSHPAAPPKTRARVTATATPSRGASGYQTDVVLRYDTGDGSVGELYAARNDGPERRVEAGVNGIRTLGRETAKSYVVYRLYAGTEHAAVLDSLTIEYLPPAVPAVHTLWANMLDAQLATEMGDTASARATYHTIIANYPGEYTIMAQDALKALDRGNGR